MPGISTSARFGGDRTFSVLAGKNYSILGAASFSGNVSVSGGNFIAGSASYPGNRAQVHVSNGGLAEIGATSYSSAGNWPGGNILSSSDLNSKLDLSTLESINAAFNDGSGGVRVQSFTASNGGTLGLSGLQSLVAPGSLKPAAKVLVEAEDESLFRIGKDYSFTHTDESTLLLGGAIVPANDNFGFGQLIVGQANRSTTVHLRDAVDNDNLHELCGTDREALYLFGLSGDPNGLRILGDATLALDGLEVYASINGVMTRIRDLFADNVDKIAFDGGWIQKGPLLPIEELPDADANGSPDIDDNCALKANDQTDTDGDGYGDECDADLNNDGVANKTDQGIFAGEFGVTNCNGLTCLSDLDEDGDVDGDDLLIYAKIGPFTLGPACPPPM